MNTLLLVIIVWILGSICSLQAQYFYTGDGSMYSHQNFIGVWGSYGYSLQNGVSLRRYSATSPKEFSAAFLPVINIGVTFETVKVANLSWRDWPSTRWEKIEPSWLFQCEYIYTQGRLEQATENVPAIRTLVGDTVMTPTISNVDISLSVLKFDILRKYRIGALMNSEYKTKFESWISPLYLAIGGTIGWAISGKMQQNIYRQGKDSSIKLLPIEGATMDEQDQRATLREEILPNINRLRFGLKAGLLYEIKALPSGRSPVNALTFTPSLWIEYPITNVQGDYSLKAFSAHIGLSILFAMNNPTIYDEYQHRYITPAEFPVDNPLYNNE